MNWSWSPATSDVPEEGIFPRLTASAAAMLSAKQLSQPNITPIMENQMEKKMENEMETGIMFKNNKGNKNINNTTSNNRSNNDDTSNTLH